MGRLGPNFELAYTTSRSSITLPANKPAGLRVFGNIATPSAMAHVYQNADALLFPTFEERVQECVKLFRGKRLEQAVAHWVLSGILLIGHLTDNQSELACLCVS
jgi:hypothetical protein